MTTQAPRPPNLHRVVIVGAGFGGLETTYRLAGAPVSITLVDRRNHHLFQPLLYQVATASLATSEIAWPIRYLLRGRQEVTTLFATVSGVDAENKRVVLDDGDTLPYDTLVLATGARHAYFGHDEWEPFAPGLKTLEDATTLRRRILVAFERAERESDPERRAALLTFVIVGAGPTGVELAGTIAELAQQTLPPDFRNIDLPVRNRQLLQFDEGRAASWRDAAGHRWSFYHFRWRPSNKALFAPSWLHTPEICLKAAGGEMKERLAQQFWNISGLQLPVRQYVFADQTLNSEPYHVFYCTWQDRYAQNQRLFLADGSRRSKLLNALNGRRPDPTIGQQVIEVFLAGPTTTQEAEALARSQLQRMIRVSK